MHTGSELYVCLTTCTGLSSSQQHLVICDLEINAVIMCGTLFLLSRCNVFSTLNQFCSRVDTSLGLSHCVVHIRRGLLGLRALPQFVTSECSLVFGPRLLSSALGLSGQCFHRRCLTRRTLPMAGWSSTGQRSSEVKLAEGEVIREGKEENSGKRDGGGGRLRPH